MLEDLTLLETWDSAVSPDSYNFFSLNRSGSFPERFSRDGFLSETSGKLVLCLRDESTTPIGGLDYRQVHFGPPGGSITFKIGIELLLEQAGFTREGVLRQAHWRMGVHHDLVMYSKLRGE